MYINIIFKKKKKTQKKKYNIKQVSYLWVYLFLLQQKYQMYKSA